MKYGHKTTHYVISTWNGVNNRIHVNPDPADVVKVHLNQLLKLKNQVSMITIMKPIPNHRRWDRYYDLDDVISKFDIPVRFLECENFGYSNGQWLWCWQQEDDPFDAYIFVEDDYVPLMDNFDKILSECHTREFGDGPGIMCSLAQGKPFCLHYEGVQYLTRETLQKLYNSNKFSKEPRYYIENIEETESHLGGGFSGGHYQCAYSELYNLSEIPIVGYVETQNPIVKTGLGKDLLQFPYWQDTEHNGKVLGHIHWYDKGSNRPHYEPGWENHSPFGPVQLADATYYQQVGIGAEPRPYKLVPTGRADGHEEE